MNGVFKEMVDRQSSSELLRMYRTALRLVTGWKPFNPPVTNTASSLPQLGPKDLKKYRFTIGLEVWIMSMILPQVHLRKPCYDFYFL